MYNPKTEENKLCIYMKAEQNNKNTLNVEQKKYRYRYL